MYNVYPLDFSTFISHSQRHDLTINLTLRGVVDESESPVHPRSQNISRGQVFSTILSTIIYRHNLIGMACLPCI